MFQDKADAELLMDRVVGDLLTASCINSGDGVCDYSEETVWKLKGLRDVAPVFGVKLHSVDFDQIDRKSNMFGGHPFTSENYPWPLNEDGNPCYPLLQVDLHVINEISGKDFGQGLLQVWLDVADPDLPDFIMIIDPVDMNDLMQTDYPDPEIIRKVDEYGAWFAISHGFSFDFLGYMLPQWEGGDFIWDDDRDLSEKETEILDELDALSKEHGYRSLKINWILGYPDRGSGSPARKYNSEPKNFIQFRTSNVFPMVDVSSYANIFYSGEGDDTSFFFDWNG